LLLVTSCKRLPPPEMSMSHFFTACRIATGDMRSTASTPYFSRVEAGLCESTVSEHSGMCSRSDETSVRRMDSSPMLSKP